MSPKYNQPSVELTLVQPWGNNFSLTLGFSRYWEHKPMESGTKSADEQPTWDLVNLVQRQSQWNSLNQVRIRRSAQAGFDWRIASSDTLTIRFWQQEPELATNRSVLGMNYGAGATGLANLHARRSDCAGHGYDERKWEQSLQSHEKPRLKSQVPA